MPGARLKRLLCPIGASPLTPDPSSRDKLLRAAIEVFERRGYAATSVREIVERAGVTKPVLYYHFGSKEGLMMSILEAAARDLNAAVEEAARLPGSARERVLRICIAVFRLVRARSSELRVSHAVYFTAAELVPSFDFQVFDRVMTGQLERSVRAGIESRELRPVSSSDAALAILGTLMLCIDQEILRRDDRLDEASLLRVLGLVLDGLCPVS